MGNVKDWAKNLKRNEEAAKKYKGVKTVKDILKLAKSDGYNFTEKELLNFNLDLVAGGSRKSLALLSFEENKTNINQKTNITKTDSKVDAKVNGNNNNLTVNISSNTNQS